MSTTVMSDAMMISTTETAPGTPSLTSPVSEFEFAVCECCGLKEECTPAYITAIRERYQGNWICGLCGEAVKDEMIRSKRLISTEEAMTRHMTFCRGSLSAPNPVVHLIAAMRQILKRSLDSPRSLRSMPSSPMVKSSESGGLARCESCMPTISLAVELDSCNEVEEKEEKSDGFGELDVAPQCYHSAALSCFFLGVLQPILAEKKHQEKVQQEKLKVVKARLNFEETSQYSESGAPSRKRDVRKRLGPKEAHSMSKTPEPRRDRSRSPRRKDPERETMFRRLEKGVFHRLGDKENGMSAYSGSSKRQSYHSSRGDTESYYQSSRSRGTEPAPKRHHDRKAYSRKGGRMSKSGDSARGHSKSKSKKQRSSVEDEDLS
ncbi:reverse transcriptase domain-containing protein [Tanacetum coccineum]|uniref:Reverse transcriptase domain-containing protein n=1 Tax=Tanacetum coccineum TaxID=301880 RepID=A0ABQ5HC01_9ASTR